MSLSIELLARGVAAALRGVRASGLREAAGLSDRDLRGSAHLLACAAHLRAWQARQRELDWDSLSARWSERASSSREPTLCGRFDRRDQVALVEDNARAFELREAWCSDARRSIDLATYYVQGDRTGKSLAECLVASARLGRRVRFVVDAYATQKKQFEGCDPESVMALLAREGVELRRWRDAARPYDANHRKLLSIDGERLLIGGRNVADHYAEGSWRDIELAVTGPSARAAQPVFDATFAGGERSTAVARLDPGALVYATTPARIESHAYWIYLLECIRASRSSVCIENAYLFAHRALIDAVRSAVERGVRVRLLSNSAETNDLSYANYRLYSGYRALVEAGAELYVREGAGRTLHCKYFVVDGRWVAIGSSNLDYYSPRFCTECNVHAEDERLAAECGAWFERGLADASRLDDLSAIDATIADNARVSAWIDRWLKDTQ
ncbi:MAG: phosphatidylserine/phosphatidylglycerophosphate/cardiolipin synthase family protein [Myxococcales bacterium]|nr:phosphatidylserine/phosphatidylglycerophosphate/cardiolipin synthase family protein [Myxococcales bacterium]